MKALRQNIRHHSNTRIAEHRSSGQFSWQRTGCDDSGPMASPFPPAILALSSLNLLCESHPPPSGSSNGSPSPTSVIQARSNRGTAADAEAFTSPSSVTPGIPSQAETREPLLEFPLLLSLSESTRQRPVFFLLKASSDWGC